MATTVPTVKVPRFYLEDKHADIRASRGEDFHYSWVVGENQLLTVEYIPGNWPALTASVCSESVEKMAATLREIGFEIEGETD